MCRPFIRLSPWPDSCYKIAAPTRNVRFTVPKEIHDSSWPVVRHNTEALFKTYRPGDNVRSMLDLVDAYAHCRQMTRDASKSFFLAAALLPAHKRRAVEALYAFARTSDNVVDEQEDPAVALDRLAELSAWRDDKPRSGAACLARYQHTLCTATNTWRMSC